MGAFKSKLSIADVIIDERDYGQDYDELDTVIGQAVVDGKVIKFILRDTSDEHRSWAEEMMRESGTTFKWANKDTLIANFHTKD